MTADDGPVPVRTELHAERQRHLRIANKIAKRNAELMRRLADSEPTERPD